MSEANTSACILSLLVSLRTHTRNSKAVPLQAWTGPEGSRRLGLPDF
jgi:hypothetical protein